jgi:hypothetical protein
MAINGLRYESGEYATQSDLTTAGGLVLVASQSFSAVSSVSVNNCFSATYDNYRLIVTHTGTAASPVGVRLRMRVSGADNSTSNYSYAGRYDSTLGEGRLLATSQTSALVGDAGDTNAGQTIDILSPALAFRTLILAQSSAWGTTQGGAAWLNGVFFANTTFDGVSIFPASSTITGSLRVYGYRNS